VRTSDADADRPGPDGREGAVEPTGASARSTVSAPGGAGSAPATSSPRQGVRATNPLMSTRQLLLMNFGFFGIQYSFGLQQNAISPIYTFLHAQPDELPLLNMAGPITGLLIQPLIGAMSDRTWSPRWGRRKPFFVIGAIGCSVCLFLFPFVTALWMAVLMLWLLDASNNTAMEPYRAFIADKLPAPQLGKGFLMQSFFTGLGATLAAGSLFVFQTVIKGGTEAGIPYWVFGSFMLGAVCSIGSVLVSVLSTPENPPTPEELAQLRAQKKGLVASVVEIAGAIRDMPPTLRKLALVYLFQWYAMFVYWQYCSLSIGQSAFPDDYSKAAGWSSLMNGFYSIVTFCSALFLVVLAKRYGAKWVHSTCLVLAGIGLLVFPHLENKYLFIIPMIGLGIAWASIMGVPYILAVASIPKNRYGVYMGVINMMIVIPMLIETFTFGAIYKESLHSDPGSAITFAAILLLLAAVAMLRIREAPTGAEENDPAAATTTAPR
jgi:maltose/moltooligosaccharide transporter